MDAPDFTFEGHLGDQGLIAIAGVDEVGRGPLAGPVSAAAVILDAANIPQGLADSKKLNHARRVALDREIRDTAQVAVAHVDVDEIDALNILRASHVAMTRALSMLDKVEHALIDGNLIPRDLPWSATAVVKGDARCLSIAAASIVAKVARDQIMVDLAQQFPGYAWDRNMGYPTKAHLEGLRNLGVTPHHRRSFKPVHQILYQDFSATP